MLIIVESLLTLSLVLKSCIVGSTVILLFLFIYFLDAKVPLIPVAYGNFTSSLQETPSSSVTLLIINSVLGAPELRIARLYLPVTWLASSGSGYLNKLVGFGVMNYLGL